MVFESRILAALDHHQPPLGNLQCESDQLQENKPIIQPSCAQRYQSEARAVEGLQLTTRQPNSTATNPLHTSANSRKTKKPPLKKMSASGQTLSNYSYKGYTPTPVIVYTRDEGEADDIVQAMRGPLGFDMEWKIFWRDNGYVSCRTALIQLCDDNIILLIQLSAMRKFPKEVKKVIESKQVVKMGVNIRGDGEKLFRDYGVLAAGLVELGGLANQADPLFAAKYPRQMVALQLMVEFYEEKTLLKGPVRKSNWENNPLTEEQREYAANDAHCALVMYKKLKSMAESSGRLLTPQAYTSDMGEEFKAGTLTMTLPPHLPKDTTGYVGVDRIEGPRVQHSRAYTLWHHRRIALSDICATLRSKENPLKESTVISYVIGALQADATLPFNLDRLKDLVYQELGSWSRHGAWIVEAEKRLR